jgi:DUF305 family protein family protein
VFSKLERSTGSVSFRFLGKGFRGIPPMAARRQKLPMPRRKRNEFNSSKANSVTCDVSSIRKTLISLGMMFSILALPVARAQDQSMTRQLEAVTPTGDEQEFVIDSDLAVSTMSLGMSVDPTGDVDRDFIAMMMPHDQGAIDVARAELKYGHDADLRRLARSLIAERESEMSDMRSAIGNQSRGQNLSREHR